MESDHLKDGLQSSAYAIQPTIHEIFEAIAIAIPMKAPVTIARERKIARAPSITLILFLKNIHALKDLNLRYTVLETDVLH